MIETLPIDFILLTVTLSRLWRVVLAKQYQTTPSKNFQKLLTPEAEKWRSRQILLRPEAEKPQFRQDWLGTVQHVPVHFEGKNVAVHFSNL